MSDFKDDGIHGASVTCSGVCCWYYNESKQALNRRYLSVRLSWNGADVLVMIFCIDISK